VFLKSEGKKIPAKKVLHTAPAEDFQSTGGVLELSVHGRSHDTIRFFDKF